MAPESLLRRGPSHVPRMQPTTRPAYQLPALISWCVSSRSTLKPLKSCKWRASALYPGTQVEPLHAHDTGSLAPRVTPAAGSSDPSLSCSASIRRFISDRNCIKQPLPVITRSIRHYSPITPHISNLTTFTLPHTLVFWYQQLWPLPTLSHRQCKKLHPPYQIISQILMLCSRTRKPNGDMEGRQTTPKLERYLQRVSSRVPPDILTL